MVDYEIDPNSTECMCSDLQTDDYSPLYAGYNLALIIIALPPLSLFGVCTNAVNIFVYSRKRAPYTTVYILPFGYMAQTCSIYFTVAAAFDCYINVCWKSLSKDYCTIRKAKQICFSVIVVSIMYNSLRFPQFNLRKCFHETSGEQIIEICPTSLFFTINMVYNVYMYMVLMTLLPFLFLLCLNAIIVLRQSLDTKQKEVNCEIQCLLIDHLIDLFSSKVDSNDSLLKPVSNTQGGGDDTITMIMVVILFLACNTLALIVNVIETFFDPDPLLLNLLSDASNFLVVLNSSVNCVIYFVFNKEYREIFLTKFYQTVDKLSRKTLCCCCRCCLWRRHRQDLVYHPVSNATITPASPVWQPLTNRQLPNVEWSPMGCYDPNNAPMTLVDDDADSGMDDGSQVSSLIRFGR
ncbi:unnamed protein product [Nippostrongylus brasiliensis]|uniref:G_PROTEIN_RECEP_F1_2 domain-containing protein n=1 Tax=Nippostrongylus brasiliensis TaxID=27835 RepID=A0A158QZR1_NIPBR|nr:unnamed protein product [Nippostrongylus brasiliensis]